METPKPSEEEILKAEAMLTPEESALSNAREEGYEGSRSEPQRRNAEERRKLWENFTKYVDDFVAGNVIAKNRSSDISRELVRRGEFQVILDIAEGKIGKFSDGKEEASEPSSDGRFNFISSAIFSLCGFNDKTPKEKIELAKRLLPLADRLTARNNVERDRGYMHVAHALVLAGEFDEALQFVQSMKDPEYRSQVLRQFKRDIEEEKFKAYALENTVESDRLSGGERKILSFEEALTSLGLSDEEFKEFFNRGMPKSFKDQKGNRVLSASDVLEFESKLKRAEGKLLKSRQNFTRIEISEVMWNL